MRIATVALSQMESMPKLTTKVTYQIYGAELQLLFSASLSSQEENLPNPEDVEGLWISQAESRFDLACRTPYWERPNQVGCGHGQLSMPSNCKLRDA
jgi:hypothetical protein